MRSEKERIEELYGEHFDLLTNFVLCLMHHRALKEIKTNPDFDFWTLAINTTYDHAILEWCKIFGKDSEETHWKKVFDDKDQVRALILQSVKMTKGEWEKYHRELTTYRNKSIGHLDKDFRPESHPDLEPAYRCVQSYYEYLHRMTKRYGILHYLPESLAEYSKAVYEQAVVFLAKAHKSTEYLSYRFASKNKG